MSLESVVEHREELKALAERDDLRCSEYARALLEAADSGG
jgi:DNA-binding GntR family transcriptional regulator